MTVYSMVRLLQTATCPGRDSLIGGACMSTSESTPRLHRAPWFSGKVLFDLHVALVCLAAHFPSDIVHGRRLKDGRTSTCPGVDIG